MRLRVRGKSFALIGPAVVILLTPVGSLAVQQTLFNYIYAHLSKTFSSKTRVTAGGYHFSSGVVARNAQRGGGQFGFEHLLNGRLTLAADWYTGKHASGYYTPGVIWKPSSKTTAYFGYSVRNGCLKPGSHFFLFELGLKN